MAKCIAIVAGEASGDILGAGLIKSLKRLYPDAEFIGIGGPQMIAQGFTSLYPMERLSVMGLVEVLGRLRELLKIRKDLGSTLIEKKPDVFIGIDAPDFNLGLETRLKEAGIKTVHYVSPSVWAWREKRVFKIKKAVDLVLCLFPFEVAFYEQHQVPAVCVGHTLADMIDMETDTTAAREQLGLSLQNPVVAILPGSRQGEVARLGELFLHTAQQIKHSIPSVQFVIPAANDDRKQQLEVLLQSVPELSVKLISGQSRTVMASADVVLLASGTAALEGMLLKKPMVVSYRLARLTYFIMSRMVKQKYVSLPNLLAGKELIPELLQHDATPENLTAAVLKLLADDQTAAKLKSEFTQLHTMLRKNADDAAAQAVANLI